MKDITDKIDIQILKKLYEAIGKEGLVRDLFRSFFVEGGVSDNKFHPYREESKDKFSLKYYNQNGYRNSYNMDHEHLGFPVIEQKNNNYVKIANIKGKSSNKAVEKLNEFIGIVSTKEFQLFADKFDEINQIISEEESEISSSNVISNLFITRDKSEKHQINGDEDGVFSASNMKLRVLFKDDAAENPELYIQEIQNFIVSRLEDDKEGHYQTSQFGQGIDIDLSNFILHPKELGELLEHIRLLDERHISEFRDIQQKDKPLTDALKLYHLNFKVNDDSIKIDIPVATKPSNEPDFNTHPRNRGNANYLVNKIFEYVFNETLEHTGKKGSSLDVSISKDNLISHPISRDKPQAKHSDLYSIETLEEARGVITIDRKGLEEELDAAGITPNQFFTKLDNFLEAELNSERVSKLIEYRVQGAAISNIIVRGWPKPERLNRLVEEIKSQEREQGFGLG